MKSARILIVEDEAIVAQDIENRLRRLGYGIVGTTPSGHEAIAWVSERDPDLVLMDVRLQEEDLDGIDAAHQIHAQYDVPVIFLTAYADDETLQRAKTTGPLGYLLKPFSTRDLHVTIEVALHKHALEQEIRASEARYRAVVEDQTELICRFKPGGQLTFVNNAFCRYLGVSASELVGVVLPPVVPEEDGGLQVLREHLERLTPENPVASFEHRLVLSKDEIRWIRRTDRAIFDACGGVLEYQFVGQDVTERHLAEDALRESERRFRALFNSINDAIFLNEVTAEGEAGSCLEANDTACQRLGYSLAELRGLKPADLVYPFNEFPSLEELIKRLFEQGAVTFERTLVSRDGTLIPVEVNASLIEWRGKSVALSVARDISERKRAEEEARLRREQLLQADKLVSLGILVAGVAHEINNPNAYIMANADTIRAVWESILPLLEKQHADQGDFKVAGIPFSRMRERIPLLLTGIEDGAKRIQRIVRELRDYARPDADGLIEPVSFAEVIESATTLLSNMIRRSTRRFTLDCPKTVPAVWGSFQRIEQVLINLIQNACQALPNPDRGIDLTVRHDVEGGRVVLVLKDEGDGIPAEVIPRLTDPFFTTKRERGGTGLGLSICASIVNDHRGTLNFESSPGAGTTVTLSFPTSQLSKSPMESVS